MSDTLLNKAYEMIHCSYQLTALGAGHLAMDRWCLNTPLHDGTSTNVDIIVNGVPCVTSKYYEPACGCVKTATVPVQVTSAAAVQQSQQSVGVMGTATAAVQTANAQTGQVLQVNFDVLDVQEC
jgi:hypothetical protein